MSKPTRICLPVFAALPILLAAAQAPAFAQPIDPATIDGPAALADPASVDDPDLEALDPSIAPDFAKWVVRSGDNKTLPFMVIDKPEAEVFVFSPAGDLVGKGPALLGSAYGDDSAPGVGDLPLSKIPSDERTTPAGRFVASFGPAVGYDKVLWIDFPDAISMHPVITSNPEERRPERLKSPITDDRRITHGCINVAAAFYRKVVVPTFGQTRGIAYVLPDTKTIDEVFPAYAADEQTRLLGTAEADLARLSASAPKP